MSCRPPAVSLTNRTIGLRRRLRKTCPANGVICRVHVHVCIGESQSLRSFASNAKKSAACPPVTVARVIVCPAATFTATPVPAGTINLPRFLLELISSPESTRRCVAVAHDPIQRSSVLDLSRLRNRRQGTLRTLAHSSNDAPERSNRGRVDGRPAKA